VRPYDLVDDEESEPDVTNTSATGSARHRFEERWKLLTRDGFAIVVNVKTHVGLRTNDAHPDGSAAAIGRRIAN
jgi:hypothetical protein